MFGILLGVVFFCVCFVLGEQVFLAQSEDHLKDLLLLIKIEYNKANMSIKNDISDLIMLQEFISNSKGINCYSILFILYLQIHKTL